MNRTRFEASQPATVQDGKAIGYVVSIGGDYQFFRDYDTALRERRQYEQSVAPDFEQMLPQPVFTHPPITLTREKIKEIVGKSFLVWLDSEKTSIEVVADLIVAELSK